MGIAVCLLSGGIDSCVATAVARERGFEPALLHVSYGQLTERREKRAFTEIADCYGIDRRLVVELPYLKLIGGSALTDASIRLPEGDLGREGIPLSYVPFRNANFLALATSWAEVLRAEAIFVGAVEEDSSGYPDCREAFFRAFEAAITQGTRPETAIRIEVPLIHLPKAEIIRKGLDLGAPLDRTWSCYKGNQIACGRCDSCLLRLRGFASARANDPIPYEEKPDPRVLEYG